MGWFGSDNRGRVLRSSSLDLDVGIVVPTVLLDADIPDGWLACEGGVCDPALYPQLHAYLLGQGSPYGVSGPNPLLPDFQGRFPVGVGGHASVASPGTNEGSPVGARTPSHAHTIPGHAHSVVSHQHSYGSHQHGSPAHTHTCELHDHSISSHGHTVSGNTGPAIDGAVDVAFTTDPTPADRISFTAHAHGNGSYGGDQTVLGSVNGAGNGASGSNAVQANGGLTGASAASVTGANSDALSASPSTASGAAVVPYLTARFIIKAEA